MSINYQTKFFKEDDFQRALNDLYNTSGPGYFVFPQFLSEENVNRIINFYTQEITINKWFKCLLSQRHIYKNCPNYYFAQNTADNYCFTHFFWNEPPNEILYAASYKVQTIRNIIESRTPFNEFFPLKSMGMSQRSGSFRFCNTRNGSPVPMHQDYIGKKLDSKRIQATLFLTQKDVDYSGQGMIFTKNNGTEIILAEEIKLIPGDLVFWRYNNFHGVRNVQSDSQQKGFIRIIYPPELIYDKPPFIFSPINLSSYLVRALKKSTMAVKLGKKIRPYISSFGAFE
jgi:hypothetical protein